MSKFLYVVHMPRFWDALKAFEKISQHPRLPSDFAEYIGITKAQWDAYSTHDSYLTVYRATDRKIDLLNSNPDASNLYTLFKIIDAQESSDAEN